MKGIEFRVWDTTHFESGEMRYTAQDLSYAREYSLDVMQCTGLKDKNGDRIFEGDILVTLWGLGCYGVVEYSDTYGMYEYVCKSRNFKYDFVSTQSDGYQVVGNIYENKDLLN